jgi:lipoyl-dependent peroxiredoxin
MTSPVYTAQARVTGGRADGHGRTTDGRLAVDLRLPTELGGDGDGTNPEQLFAVGYAGCFASVLDMLVRKQKLDANATVESRVSLNSGEDGTFTLGVELDIALPSVPDAGRLVGSAHELCPYSRAIRGNVDVTLIVNGTRQ